ncbi:MAG: hypothetical protein WBQ24_00470 [Xanthobacteraceae bacterium]|jgi:hypothetical protein
MAGLVPAIHVFGLGALKTWMPGTRPGMTAHLVTVDSAAVCRRYRRDDAVVTIR